jgi:hypothetical protein
VTRFGEVSCVDVQFHFTRTIAAVAERSLISLVRPFEVGGDPNLGRAGCGLELLQGPDLVDPFAIAYRAIKVAQRRQPVLDLLSLDALSLGPL